MKGAIASRRSVVIGACIVLALTVADAHALFVVNQPWIRPAAAARSTEVYMNLTSTEGAALVGVRSDGAAEAALHGPHAGTRPVRELALPAGTIVELKPGGNRIGLRRLARTVRLGDRVGLTLIVRGADGTREEIPVVAVARLRSPVDDERRAHRHRH